MRILVTDTKSNAKHVAQTFHIHSNILRDSVESSEKLCLGGYK
jgi:hypothetical protein